jgi:hypothetical protein
MPHPPIPITFSTANTRTRAGWNAFYLARDRFLHEQLRRRGFGAKFGTYEAPDGNTVDVWLTPEDLRQHTLILGATGTGKSSLIEAIAEEHLRSGRGFALIDLHGDLFNCIAARALVAHSPNVTVLDFTQPEFLPSWNPLKQIDGVDVGRHVDLLVGVLKRLYAHEDAASWAWGVKVEEIVRHILRAAIESQTMATLVDIKSYLLIPSLRQKLLETCEPETRTYFANSFGKREEMYVSAVLNKLDPFLSSLAVQRFLGSPTPRIDLLKLIDRSETILINLPRGFLGPTADVLGRLFLNVLQLAVLRREAVAPASRRPFSILLDEAHNLAHAGSGLEDLLVSARKYRVAVTLAAQSLSLFPASFRPHLLGNTGRQFFFRMPFAEAKALAADLFEPLGTMWRNAVRPYDSLKDPLLTPEEEIAARTRELASMPVGACYWMIRPRRFRARRILVSRGSRLPVSVTELRNRIVRAMKAVGSERGAQPGRRDDNEIDWEGPSNKPTLHSSS